VPLDMNYTVDEVDLIVVNASEAFIPTQPECPAIKFKISVIRIGRSGGIIP
jgi:hypothetical protein